MSKREIIKLLVASAAVVIISIVTAAAYIGSLEARVTGIEGERLDLEAFLVAERQPGPRMEFANTVRWGTWSQELYCPANHYVCGLAQKAEEGVGDGSDHDDTAVNGIAFYCCSLRPGADNGR